MGMSVGHSPNEPHWTPDMRKDDGDITEADKKDAKRRIQGSASVGDSPDDSPDEETARRRASAQPTMTTMAASAM